jgi:hypothetical protein
MSISASIPLLFLLTAIASGQSAPNSITVTASRAATLQPDQVNFGVTVTSPLTATQSDVLAVLQSVGLTAANFSSVTTVQQYSGDGRTQTTTTVLQWTFNLTAPIANMKSTVATFSALQIAVAQLQNGMSITTSVLGTQVSPQAQQAQPCPLSGLISDARVQAQNIANASSMTVGAILSISSSTSSGFSAAPACSLTVKFSLGGF